VCLVVIICNTAYTIFDTNYGMTNITKTKTVFMSAVEASFTSFYALELGLKLWVHRLYFFCNADMRWNILDAILVASGLLEVFTNSSSNPSFIRMVRIIRITRALRMVRLLRFFAELRLMLNCVIGSIVSLLWAFCLIFAFSVLFATVLVQHLTSYLVEAIPQQQVSDNLVTDIQKSFGSVQVATFSLFKCISGGDWTTYYEIVEPTGWFNAVVFLVYILFVWLSVTNIITCIFVEKAMKLAQPDVDELLFEKRKEEIESAEELQNLFDSIDTNQSGSVTWEEFEKFMTDERVTSYLEVNGLDINDAYMFFRMLASSVGSKEIDVNTLVRGCLKLKGLATNIDLLQLSYEVKVISKSQQHLFMALEKQLQGFRGEIGDSHKQLSMTMSDTVYHVCKQVSKQLTMEGTKEMTREMTLSSLSSDSPDDLLTIPGTHSLI